MFIVYDKINSHVLSQHKHVNVEAANSRTLGDKYRKSSYT